MTNLFPKFSKKDPKKFFKTLNSRVNRYFKENNLKKTGNWKLYSKSLIIFGIFAVPYFLIMLFNFNLHIFH